MGARSLTPLLLLTLLIVACDEQALAPEEPVGCAPLTFEQAQRSIVGTVGRPLDLSAVPESAGQGTLSYRIVVGELLPGLRLEEQGLSRGHVTGVPSEVGQASVTIVVEDECEEPATGTVVLSIYVLAGSECAQIQAPAELETEGVVATSFTYALPVSGGFGELGFALTSGNLPQGLSLNGGTVSGRPTAAGIDTASIAVSDQCPGGSQGLGLTLRIEILPTP